MFGFLQESQSFNKNGIGLGLVISDNIVKQFRGRMSFESEFGRGSKFSFTFELKNEEESSIEGGPNDSSY